MSSRLSRLCVPAIWAGVLAIGCGATDTPASPSPAAADLTPVTSGSGWTAATPAAQGLDETRLKLLVGRLRQGEFGAVTSVVIARNGRLVLEEYFDGWSASRAHTMQSVSKSVTSLIVGLAIQTGKLSLDTPLVSAFPAYAPAANLDDRKRAITVRHLLMMRSGLDWSEDPYAGSPLQRLNDCRCDWLRFVLDWPMREPPGTRWEYVSGGVIALAGMVASTTGERFDAFAARTLFAPLGIEGAYWYQGQPDGLAHAGGGLMMRPRDMAKLGQLVLDDGRWQGAQVVPTAWMRESTSPLLKQVRTFGPRPADYGYLWWQLPGGIITASGAQGQWIFADPQTGLVVTVTGANDATFSSGPTIFYDHVSAAVTAR